MTTHPFEGIRLAVTTGIGRSGTTALRNAIETHPAIAGTGRENNVVHDVLEAARFNCSSPSRAYAMRTTAAEYDGAFRRLVLELLWPESAAQRSKKPSPALLHCFTALTVERLGYLRRLFPGVRVVHIVRNGIEVVASRIRFEGFRHHSFEGQCRVWAGNAELWRESGASEDALVVRHEELRAEPAATMGRVFGFLGLVTHAGATDLLTGKVFHPTPDEPAEAELTSLEQRATRWTGWTEEERATFSEICGGAMREMGYEIPWESGSAPVVARARARASAER